jgi:endonuclease/exonuclease/phosphatase family metal-dependent hydrolase
MMKITLKIAALIIMIPLLGLAVLLTYSTLTDYKPAPGSIELLPLEGEGATSQVPDTFSVMIWNIGYCGLGAEMDFFHDGGSMVRPDSTIAAQYLKAVSLFIGSMRDSVDFIMLQEVDRASKRSYFKDQMSAIAAELPKFYRTYAVNYRVNFVPVPFRWPYEPYGATNGGLVTFSKYRPLASSRIQYPGGFSWPSGLYMLDRCALEQHYNICGNRKLILVNTHNTAYDETGAIKRQEMQFISERYGSEKASGQLVLLGGDWNQLPPGYHGETAAQLPPGYTAQALDHAALPSRFNAIFDVTTPTNRALTEPYQPGRTFTTLIDYFIASPAFRVLKIKTIDLQFKWSDHQPVILTLTSQ